MTGIKRYTNLAILRGNHPRISVPPTHFPKISKKKIMSDFHGIGSKFLYPRNQHESLNQFQFFKIKKSPTQKSCVDFKSRNST